MQSGLDTILRSNPSLFLDNKPFKLNDDLKRKFNKIEVNGKIFDFNYSKAGTIILIGHTLRVSLILWTEKEVAMGFSMFEYS